MQLAASHFPTSIPPASYGTGEQLAWLAKANAKMVFLLPRLHKELKRDKTDVANYLAAVHPDASGMERDAMYHGYLSARMTERYGQTFTLFLGYWNEAKRDLIGNNATGDRGMDLYNNRAASDFATAYPNLPPEALLDALWQKAQDGTLATSMLDARALQRHYADDNLPASRFFEHLREVTETIYGPAPLPAERIAQVEHHGTHMASVSHQR